MKTKNLFYGVLVVLFIILFSSCCDGESGSCINTAKADNVNSTRIIVKSVGVHRPFGYQIIEVDAHEYLVSDDGGVVHLESCICKQK